MQSSEAYDNEDAFIPAMSSDAVEHTNEDYPHTQIDVPHANKGANIIVFPEGASRADAVYLISQQIPTNHFGLPLFFIRSDLLPPLNLVTQEDIDAASVGIFYNDGFPVLDSGITFWNQLPHEPHDAHALFVEYLNQAAELGIRQMDLLSGSLNEELSKLNTLYKEFYWGARARAYDLFIVAAERKKREHRIRLMENEHYTQAGALLDRLKARFEDPEWIEELNAKEAIEAVETLIKIQRLSVGLTGQHASSNQGNVTPQGASAEVILRQVSQGAGISEGAQGRFSQQLASLMSDPEQGMVLQEAILRITAPDNRQSFGEAV